MTTGYTETETILLDRIKELEAQVKVLRDALNLVPKNILSGQTHRIVINTLSETEVKPKVKR